MHRKGTVSLYGYNRKNSVSNACFCKSAKTASLRRYYPVQVVRVRILTDSISAIAPLASLYFIRFNYNPG